jgi:hypothetical protein
VIREPHSSLGSSSYVRGVSRIQWPSVTTELNIIATQLSNALASVVAVEAKRLEFTGQERVIVSAVRYYVVGHPGRRDLPCIGAGPAQWLEPELKGSTLPPPGAVIPVVVLAVLGHAIISSWLPA